MKTLTVRMADQDYDELSRIAASRGTTLSDLSRETLAGLTRVTDENDQAFSEAPATLDVVTRHQLALLHRILAHVVDNPAGDGDSVELARARVLEQGYVEEYDNEFRAIEPELSRRESDWVRNVLEMFEDLESSFLALTDAEQSSLGEHAKHRVTFGGFDLNDRLESRLLGYARHLIDQGKWQPLAKYFSRDRGNSHRRRYDVYDRMLQVYLPIWKVKLREGARTFDPDAYQFTADEISRIIAAAIHPSRRSIVARDEQTGRTWSGFVLPWGTYARDGRFVRPDAITPVSQHLPVHDEAGSLIGTAQLDSQPGGLGAHGVVRGAPPGDYSVTPEIHVIEQATDGEHLSIERGELKSLTFHLRNEYQPGYPNTTVQVTNTRARLDLSSVPQPTEVLGQP